MLENTKVLAVSLKPLDSCHHGAKNAVGPTCYPEGCRAKGGTG